MSVNFTPEMWAVIGLVLIVADMLTFTFVFFFFGAGALLTALLVWSGLVKAPGLQLVVFAIASISALLAFRKWARNLFGKNKDQKEYSDIAGQKARVSVKIPSGGEGKVSFRGSQWLAHCDLNCDIDEGTDVIIDEVDGIKLKVSPVVKK